MSPLRSLSAIAIVAAAALLCARTASPQTRTDAGTALQALIHGAQGDPSTQPLLAPAIARLIATEIGTFPIASSSSGFTYTFDPVLGIPVLSTKSFGPLFTERPETTGRGKWAVGFNVQHINWDSIDGLNLKNGDLGGFLRFDPTDPNRHQSFIDLATTTAVFGVTAGVTDRIDVGVSVPLVRVSVSGRTVAPIVFDGNRTAIGSSTGLGDVGFRAKVRIVKKPELELSGSVQMKLPTGDEARLLGTGKPAYRVLLVGSARSGIVASHVNVGYTFAGNGFPPNIGGLIFSAASVSIEPSDEINYSGGVDVAAGTRLSVNADVVGRSMKNSAQVFALDELLSLTPRARLPLLLGVVGVKFNVASQWLLLVNVLFPLTEGGLKPSVTPVLGFERAF